MRERSGARSAALPALMGASVLWGTTGTAAHFMPGTVGPIAIGAVTMGLGGLLLFAFSAHGSISVFRDPQARGWALVGVVGVFIYPLAFYTGMHFAGVAIGNVVALGSGPVFAAILEWILEGDRPSARWLVGTAVAVGGIVTLALLGSRPGTVGSREVETGVLVALLAGLAYAVYTYSSSRVIRGGHPGRDAMGALFGGGAVLLLPVLVLVGAALVHSSTALGIAAYLVIAPMFIAYLLFAVGLRSLPSSTVTTITLIEPVVATVLAVTVVGESLTAFGWLGLLVILIGVGVLATARLPDNTQ